MGLAVCGQTSAISRQVMKSRGCVVALAPLSLSLEVVSKPGESVPCLAIAGAAAYWDGTS